MTPVGDKDVKLTDADVNYEWVTPKHDWADTNPEVLVGQLSPARKQESGRPESSLSEAAANGSGRDKKAEAPKSSTKRYWKAKIVSDTGFEFITTINCRPFKPIPSRLLQLFFLQAENSSAQLRDERGKLQAFTYS